MIVIAHLFVVLLLLMIGGPCSPLIASSLPIQIYVVPFPSLFSNNGNGSLAHPYTSLEQALDHIQRDYYYRDINSTRTTTTINLYPTHHFVNTIHFRQAHSHTRLTTMSLEDIAFYEKIAAQEHTHQRLSRAIISGGVLITNWTQVSTNTYSAVVPSSMFVNQLFINNQRIVRTRVPTNFSDYLQYAAPLNDSILGRYGFQYVPGQFDYKSLTDAMVVVYHSFTESHHYIDRLITVNNTVLFSNPAFYLIGPDVVQGKRRFHIENLCEALVQNSFCFVNETKTVYLMTDGSYDPTKVEVITSVNEIVVSIASNDSTKPVENVIIDNVAIQHGAWNIARTQLGERAEASFLTSVALFIANATSITILNIEISHTGSYGLHIREGTSNIVFMNSLVNDTGAGGVWMGDWKTPISILARSNKIISNEISYGGNVFPSGAGVLVLRATDIVIADNLIHHHRHNGISVGSQNDYVQGWTTDIIIEGNYIYAIGQHILCDLGGIYTLGLQPGTVITGNVIKNVFSYAVYMWGIYLDNGASDMLVSNNVVYNTGWAAMFQHYGANNTIINNVFARASVIPPSHPDDLLPDGDVRIQIGENHTSWIYMHNIVYDTFQGANHSAVKIGPNAIAPFNNNVYYNPYGTPLLFGLQQTSFAEWQKTGKDTNSVIEDPLFAGDINQCDFFTVQATSPAARLGFTNITKPSKWTPGCDVDDVNNRNQFYHW
jgi:parallel beta-helix repeat protein